MPSIPPADSAIRALIVVSDPNAEGFYLKMGCRRIGTRPSELEDGRQLPLLRLAL
mgnify:CR=1 FL=1